MVRLAVHTLVLGLDLVLCAGGPEHCALLAFAQLLALALARALVLSQLLVLLVACCPLLARLGSFRLLLLLAAALLLWCY